MRALFTRRFACPPPGASCASRVRIEPPRGLRGRCSKCRQPAPGYDRLPERWWLFVPLWGIVTRFWYAPRRVECPEHGVVVEPIPWSEGKRPVTTVMMGFLARWARRLSWRETAQVFQTRWEAVYRSVEWFGQWGLAHRKLEGVESIGVDDLHWGRGLSGLLVLASVSQPPRADEEGRTDAAVPRRTAPELVQGQRGDFQRCRGGAEQQNPSGDQTSVWFSHL